MVELKSRKEKNKDRIVRTAVELFQTHGFRKVSINDIAERAGVSPVTVYNHFGTKDELIRDTVKTISYNLLEVIREVVHSDIPFLEKLDTIIFDKAEVASRFQGELMQSLVQKDPEINRFANEIRINEVNRLMFELFEEGKREGFISQEFTPDALLLYCEILHRGITAIDDFSDQVRENPDLTRQIIAICTYGLNG